MAYRIESGDEWTSSYTVKLRRGNQTMVVECDPLEWCECVEYKKAPDGSATVVGGGNVTGRGVWGINEWRVVVGEPLSDDEEAEMETMRDRPQDTMVEDLLRLVDSNGWDIISEVYQFSAPAEITELPVSEELERIKQLAGR